MATDDLRAEENPGAAIWSRVLSGSAWALGGKIFLAAKGVLLNMLLARMLPPAEFGVFFLAQSLVVLGTTIGMLGVNRSIVRVIAESCAAGDQAKAADWIRSAFLLVTAGAVSVFLLLIVFRGPFTLTVFDSPLLFAAAWLIAGWMVANILQQIVAECFRGFHDIRGATVFGGALSGLLLLVSLSIMMFVGDAGLTGVLWLMILSIFVSGALGWLLLHDRVKQLTNDASEAREDGHAGASMEALFRLSLPMLVANITFFTFGYADIWVVGAFRTETEVAVYGAASRLVMLIGMPLVVVNLVVPPLIAELYGQGRRRELQTVLRQLTTLSGIPALIVLLVFAIAAGPVMRLVFGGFYTAGASVLVVRSLGAISNVLAGSCGIALMMTGHERQHMILTVIISGVTVAMMILGVQWWGIQGVAAAASLGLVLQNVGMLLLVRLNLGIWTHATIRDFDMTLIRRALQPGHGR